MLLEEDVAMAIETHSSQPAELPPSVVSWQTRREASPADPEDLPPEKVIVLHPPVAWPRVFPPL